MITPPTRIRMRESTKSQTELTTGKIVLIIWLRSEASVCVEMMVLLEVVVPLERTGVSRIFGMVEAPLKRMGVSSSEE